MKYVDPSGKSGITITTATVLKLLLVTGGAALSVTYGYLRSKAGQKAINVGARIQYAGIIYNAVTFIKTVRVVTTKKITTLKAVKLNTEVWSNSTAVSLETKAIKARDKEVTKARALSSDKRDDITTIAAGYNRVRRKIAVGINKTSIYHGTLCAEDLVVRQLGGKKAINAIIMTAAIRPRTLKVIPVCKRCQSKYSKKHFIKGTPFE